MKRAFVIVIALIGLVGCDAVDVSVGEEITSEALMPTARPLPIPQTDEFDEFALAQTVFSPNIIFSPAGNYVEPFVNQENMPFYVLKEEFEFAIVVDWRSVWLSGAEGELILELAVAIKTPEMEAFEEWAQVSTGFIGDDGPSFGGERLFVEIDFPESGVYDLRSSVYIEVTSDAFGEQVLEPQTQNRVIVFDSPDDSWRDAHQFFRAPFGNLEYQGVLPDWRAWNLGPCDLFTENPDLTRLIDDACLAYEGGNLQEAAPTLFSALNNIDSDDPIFVARLRDQLGLIAMTSQEWVIAVRQFRESLNLWQNQGRAFETMNALHNLGIALVMAERGNEGWRTLEQAIQLREQLEDYEGATLTWASLVLYWEAYDDLDEILWAMQEEDMPQFEPFAEWVQARQ